MIISPTRVAQPSAVRGLGVHLVSHRDKLSRVFVSTAYNMESV